MKKKDNKKCCSDKLMILMMICVFLSLSTLAIVVYDKFVKVQNPVPACANNIIGD